MSRTTSGAFGGGGPGGHGPPVKSRGRGEKANTPPFDNLFLKFFQKHKQRGDPLELFYGPSLQIKLDAPLRTTQTGSEDETVPEQKTCSHSSWDGKKNIRKEIVQYNSHAMEGQEAECASKIMTIRMHTWTGLSKTPPQMLQINSPSTLSGSSNLSTS